MILIGQYGLDGAAGSVSRSSGNLFGVTAGSFTRKWFGGFAAGSYTCTYFVVLDLSPSRLGMRVLRVCDNSNETSVAAMYEAEIICFSSGAVDESSAVVGVSLLESFPSGGATLVIGLVTNVNPYNRVCTVGLSSVDSVMNTANEHCQLLRHQLTMEGYCLFCYVLPQQMQHYITRSSGRIKSH